MESRRPPPSRAGTYTFTDWRFLGVVLVLNFVVVPVVVFGLSRAVAADQAVLVGVLFMLLTPCVDYVIVFTGLAGGARARLLAATPLLMLLQIVLLPVYLWLMAGAEVVGAFDPHPFVEAFLALRILGGGEGVKSAGDQEHAEPVVVVVGEAAGDPAGEFDEPVHGLGAAVG